MALYLGDKKVCPTLTIEKTLPSMKAFFDAGGRCAYSSAQSFEGCWQPTDSKNVTNMGSMFNGCSKLTTIPQLDTSNVNNMFSMFFGCSSLTAIPQLDTSKVTNMGDMFSGCSKLTTIPQLDISNVNNTLGMFSGCSSLTAIHMININHYLDISSSTKFTREALVEIIGNLKAQTRYSKTLTMGSTNLAKLTDEDKAVATGKGWTLE